MISAHLKFEIANQPITSPVTKLGGRPIWIDEPAWPRSRSSGNLMFFIGQVELDRQLFPLALNDMAYLFMTDDWGADLTWDPNAGENAIIFQSYPNALRQPFNESCAPPRVIERDVVAHMTFVDEPPFATASERDNWSDDQRSRYWKALRGCKVGGSPLFIQDDEIPISGDWVLIAQLKATTLPFLSIFGGDGVGYAFANSTCTEAKLIWQC